MSYNASSSLFCGGLVFLAVGFASKLRTRLECGTLQKLARQASASLERFDVSDSGVHQAADLDKLTAAVL